MRAVNELKNQSFDSKSLLSLVLLIPPVLWWAALFLSLTVSKQIAEFLGGSFFQIIVLIACPLLAVILGVFTVKKTLKLQWITAL